MLFDYFYLVLLYIMLCYQGQAMRTKFPNFCLWISHGSLGVFWLWFVVGFCLFGFFFHEDIWTSWKFRTAAELPNLYSSCCKESVLS